MAIGEKLEIEYEEKEDGILYPKIKLWDDTQFLGKYGQMCLDYLMKEHPERFVDLILMENVTDEMKEVNEQVHETIDTIVFDYLKTNPPSDLNWKYIQNSRDKR